MSREKETQEGEESKPKFKCSAWGGSTGGLLEPSTPRALSKAAGAEEVGPDRDLCWTFI